MHLKSMRITPSLISVSVTPVPTPGTSTTLPPVVEVVDADGALFEVPLPHAQSAIVRRATSARGRSFAGRSECDQESRKRDEFYQVIRPVVDGAVGHHEDAVGLE